MRKSIEIVTCDLCGENGEDIASVNYPVVFLTEQDEGRPHDPYISNEVIDVCADCRKRVLKIEATGCMGFNNYKVVEE